MSQAIDDPGTTAPSMENPRILSTCFGDEQSEKLISALSSPTRRAIVTLLEGKRLNVNEIAAALDLPQSTVATSVKLLSEAGIIQIERVPGSRGGMQKLCSIAYEALTIELPSMQRQLDEQHVEIEMPIGLYADYEVSPTCGLCSNEAIIGQLDAPQTFSMPERSRAALLWFSRGYVEYKFPRNVDQHQRIERLEISFEVCSEAPNSAVDWPSDITVWVNGKDIGTWTSPSEFGEPRGTYTPEWWRINSAQFGELKRWEVTDAGSFIDGEPVTSTTLADLGLHDHHSIRVRIGLKEDAENLGGVNIFGRGFGNYDQDIQMRIHLA